MFIIIPTHNRWSEARKTLAALFNSEYTDFEVVLIDDGSSDGTYEQCLSLFPEVHVIQGDGNLWWSGAINKGLEYALNNNAELILWMNDDTRVEPHTITRLLEVYNKTGPRSVISCRVKSTRTGNDEWVGEPSNWNPLLEIWKTPDLSPPFITVEHPPGGRGVLFPAACFKELGVIDRRQFPHYWADHDFHYRAMIAGYRYYLATNAVIWNVPNPPSIYSQYSFSWGFNYLFSRRSAMNIITMCRLLKRYLKPYDFKSHYYLWARRTILFVFMSVCKSVLEKCFKHRLFSSYSIVPKLLQKFFPR